MPLVAYDPNFRRTWMFPRNIRRIHPWKIAQICSLLRQELQGNIWSGNQSIQNAFCKALEAAKLKRTGVQYDPKSGGPRTYLAQLKCLGLVFERNDGTIWFTKAGEDLAEGKPPLPILQKLLLRHQYPSAYSRLRNSKIHPEIKIKPFLFILRLLADSRITSLNNEELTIPVVYGHNEDCYELCVDKILALRKSKNMQCIAEPRKALYTPRTAKRDIDKSLKDVKHIANTCKNYLQGACFVISERVNGKEIIRINKDILPLVNTEVRRSKIFIPVTEEEESFQRAYGCLDQVKDTRSLTKESISLEQPAGKHIIMALFYQYCGEKVVLDYPEKFVGQMKNEFGFEEAFVRKTIEPLVSKALSFYESTFIELSKGGVATALRFEKAVGELFEKRLFFTVKHTGQLRRPSGVGGYSDHFIKSGDNKRCALVEVKSSPSYNLSADDYYAMVSNYIPNYKELCGGEDLLLEFCLYVAGGFREKAAKTKLKEIHSATRIPATGITAFELLRVVQHGLSKAQQDKICVLFKENKIVTAANLNKDG
jgi:hypothetical protein